MITGLLGCQVPALLLDQISEDMLQVLVSFWRRDDPRLAHFRSHDLFVFYGVIIEIRIVRSNLEFRAEVYLYFDHAFAY